MFVTEKQEETTSQTLKDVKIYLRALPIRRLEDIEIIKTEVSAGNILIIKLTPLAKKSIVDTEQAVDKLCTFVKENGGEIARLGDERLIITPPSVKIWKEK